VEILVLRYKYGDICVCARDDEEKAKAYLYLFHFMAKYGFYDELVHDVTLENSDQKMYYERAVKDDAKAAQILLSIRSDHGYEYEEIDVLYPVIP